MREANRLTPLRVQREKKPGRYHDGGGLYLQISKWGTKSWVFRFMRDRKAKMMGLGSVSNFSLKEARERARAQRQLLTDAVDPLEVRRRASQDERLKAARSITFKEAAEAYIAAYRQSWKNPKHADQWRSTLATYAYPVFGDLPVQAIDDTLVLRVLEPIWGTKTETASRVRGRIESVLAWATVRKYRAGDNPARWRNHLDQVLPERAKVAKVKHMEAMPWAEVPALMADLRANDSMSARALEFIILTAARTGEAIGARWDEIDLSQRVWIVPSGRTKTSRPHAVPLSDRVVAILKALPREMGSPFVFMGATPKRPLSNWAALELLKGMRPNSGLTVHGFRSSFRDWTADAGYPRDVCEAALGHSLESKVEAAYRRTDLLERRRKLMQMWAGYCAKPASRGDKVVALRKQ